MADDADTVAKARDDFRDGVALMTAGDFARALAKFKLVSRVKMNAQVAFNIGECEEHLGRLVSALGNFRLAAAKASDGSAPAVSNVVGARIEAVEARIAHLTIERVEPTSNARASIQIDGAEVAATQLGKPLPVDPGQRAIEVVVGGKVVSSRKTTLADGETQKLKVVIPPPSSGDAAQPAEVKTLGPSAPGIVLSASGGAVLVSGFVFIGLRQAALSDLDTLCGGDHTCPASAKPTADRGKIMTGLAEVTIPVGVAALTTGIVLLATHHSRSQPEPEKQAWLTPTIEWSAPGADGPGMSVGARF